ncbi:hypothetical protein AB9P05_11825 [Roseivirga sp. BDSF3-8]|uniref:hypothetical protein n=1 Tax=Roseivirga sp. BDSF3-8 TaxID=3241598 RepID=UPI003531872A
MRILKRVFLVLLLLIIALFCLVAFANYSDGVRVGVPIKVSKRGVLIKTWEGQLNTGGFGSGTDGVGPTVWEFSVAPGDADEVLEELNTAIENGHRVKLFYKEKYIKLFWLGDTEYFVYDVQELNN